MLQQKLNALKVLAVCKYIIIATAIGNTCLKITIIIFCYIAGYPTIFNVYNCFLIKQNILSMLKSYW